jgi:hypothetical protein
MVHEIIKTYNSLLGYWLITCPEGCKITSWKEGDDIMDYSSFTIAYCPANADLDTYHCISSEDDERIMEEQLRIIEATK